MVCYIDVAKVVLRGFLRSILTLFGLVPLQK